MYFIKGLVYVFFLIYKTRIRIWLVVTWYLGSYSSSCF